jgi:hypothetical protein
LFCPPQQIFQQFFFLFFFLFFFFLPPRHDSLSPTRMRPWTSAAWLLLAPWLALGSPVDKLKHEFIEIEVPQLEHVRLKAEAVLTLRPHEDCFFGGHEASFSARESTPRTVSAECARASIPTLDRNGDYTANVSVAERTPSLPSRGLFLPRAAKGAEVTLFPTVPCGASARFAVKSGGVSENHRTTETPVTAAAPIDGSCDVDAAVPMARGDWFASGAERFSIFAAPGDAIQDWRDTPAPTQEPQFRVYDEEWAVGCLGLSDTLWECYPLVPSRRDRAGEGIPVEPGWNVDRHAQVLIEKRLQRGEIDWDSEVPLCDVPVFDAAAEARAHPDTPLHELFSERYRRKGAHRPALIVNDPSISDFAARDRGIRPEVLADEDNPGALLFRNIDFAGMKRGRLYNRFRMVSYGKKFFNPTPPSLLEVLAFPRYPDPVCLRDVRMTPHTSIWSGEPGDEYFFARDAYHFGGTGTSTTFHVHRASWLRLHGGTKIWFFYPPKSGRTAHRARLDSIIEFTAESLATTWLLSTYDHRGDPAQRQALNFSYAQSVREGAPPMVCVQRPGTFMLVGDDWFHAVVNIGFSAGTAAFSQSAHTNTKQGTLEYNRLLAEYPVKGHTARSMPDEK